MDQYSAPVVNSRKKTIEFHIRHDCASQISLAGSFNHWAKDELLLKPGAEGTWTIKIPMLPKGKHYYKFYVDHSMWVEDVENPYREPDGVTGWNSVITVE